jgi:hypothetical protein
MTESNVWVAERVANRRAVVLLALAAVLIASEVVALRSVERPLGLAVWVVLVVCAALTLLPGSWVRSREVAARLEDELTREHRLLGAATGFGVALVSGLVIAVVAQFVPLSGAVAARIIVTAGLSAGLIAFAVRERQATA